MPGAVADLDRARRAPGRAADRRHPLPRRQPRRRDATFRAGPGRGVRRTTLHAALSAARRPMPASPSSRVAVRRRRAARRPPAASTASRPATWSPPTACTRRSAGWSVSTRRPRGRRRFGLRCHFAVAPWTTFVEVHWAPPGEAYVTPVGRRPGRRRRARRRRRAASTTCSARFPALRERLDRVLRRSRVRGAGPLRQRSRARVAGRVLLVGDAAGYVDALTGEGIALGLGPGAGRGRRRSRGRRPSATSRRGARLGWRHDLLTHGLLRGDPARPYCGAGSCRPRPRVPWLFSAAVNELARPA